VRFLPLIAALLASASAPASGAVLVLTGLARLGGETRAYFAEPPATGHFSLAVGETVAGIRLVSVDLPGRTALVADADGIRRIAFASGDGTVAVAPKFQARRVAGQPDVVPGGPDLFRRDEYVAQIAQGLADADVPVADPRTPRANPAAEGAASGEKTGPPPRRAPTEEELFKSRNGYAAWEARERALRQGIAVSAPEP
jgi:hypothetical protein